MSDRGHSPSFRHSSSHEHSNHRRRDDDRRRDDRNDDSSSRSHKHSGSSRQRRRSRSPSPRRHRKEEEEERDGSEEEAEDWPGPPPGVGPLDDGDFFVKSNELRLWLHEEKHKRFDTLRSEESRRYFRKFVKKWNRGLLPSKYYLGISSASLPTTISSSHAWSFSKATQRELDDASSIRKSIDTGSRPLPSRSSTSAVLGPSGGPRMGPTMPPSRVEGLHMSREAQLAERESRREVDKYERKKAAKDAREEERDSKATGRERIMEKRREVGGKMKELREAKEGGGIVEMDEETLGLSGSGTFADALAAKNRNMAHGKKAQIREEKQAVMQDKLQTMRSKEDQTMAMFKQLAAERFGSK